MLQSIVIFYIGDYVNKNPIILIHERQKSFLFDTTAKEISVFMSRELIKKTPDKEKIVVEDKGYIGHSMRMHDLGAVVITKTGYPQRVAFKLALECIIFVKKSIIYFDCLKLRDDANIEFEPVKKMFIEYQNPDKIIKSDKLLNVQNELESVKYIMVQNIEDLLNRGSKLEDIVSRTQDLSDTSKTFVRKTKDLNRCCTIL
jgi:synaptobrevin family protein YKT6